MDHFEISQIHRGLDKRTTPTRIPHKEAPMERRNFLRRRLERVQDRTAIKDNKQDVHDQID